MELMQHSDKAWEVVKGFRFKTRFRRVLRGYAAFVLKRCGGWLVVGSG